MVVHNLTTGAYVFSSDAGAFTTRFEIIYQNALSIDVPAFNANQVVIYKNSVSEFVINTGSIVIDNVKLFDIRGRLLQVKTDVNAFETTIGDYGLSDGILLIQITSENGEVVTKKVVR